MVYRIIPKLEVIINAETKKEAMEKYLLLKDTEVDGLFQAVTEEEWKKIRSDEDYEGHKRFLKGYMMERFMEKHNVSVEEANRLKELAYEAYVKQDDLRDYEAVDQVYTEYVQKQ
ncbi:hypothetical protein [Butyrivibrio sp.]|uniref:hypothetical protein n=1 Tax=Butyrivibrio sp. TaxID=28121 RepID=UPI0025BB9609|nr:hypothetical protein [Butyrivibrio sp.]MBQ9304747.1 hypothetical protein [Butyrivibrio sp.]